MWEVRLLLGPLAHGVSDRTAPNQGVAESSWLQRCFWFHSQDLRQRSVSFWVPVPARIFADCGWNGLEPGYWALSESIVRWSLASLLKGLLDYG